MTTDYSDMSIEELKNEYDRVVAAQADRGRLGLSFTMDAMVEAGDLRREIKRRESEGR